MSRAIPRTAQRRPGQARGQRRIVVCLAGGALLAALSFAGHGLAQRHAQTPTPAARMGQPAAYPYHRVPALLAQARTHDPVLRLPHARWFIRVRHGHAQVVVVDHMLPQHGGGTIVGRGSGQ